MMFLPFAFAAPLLSTLAAPAPILKRPPPTVVDRCAPEAVKEELRAAAAAVPDGPDAAAAKARARAAAFRTRATACITARLGWVSTAPNRSETWERAKYDANAFLYPLWYAGVLVGDKPATAYFTRCDATTMTQLDIEAGRLILLYGGALVAPAEFEIDRVRLNTAPPAP